MVPSLARGASKITRLRCPALRRNGKVL